MNALAAMKSVRDAICEHCAKDGSIIWMNPPHQLCGVHESAVERLDVAIEKHEALLGQLVEALEACLHKLESFESYSEHGPFEESDLARAAIAKATE